jgi:hypothetical protein
VEWRVSQEQALCSESLNSENESVLHYIVLGKKDQQHHTTTTTKNAVCPSIHPILEREKMKSERDPDFSPSVQL